MSGYGNRGYLRTLEAVIAIVLILLFIYAVTPRRIIGESEVPANVESAQRFIFMNLSFRDDVRECLMSGVTSNCETSVNSVVKDNLPGGYTYSFVICNKTSCTKETPFDKNVYMSDIFISSSLSEQNPKIIRLYIWEG